MKLLSGILTLIVAAPLAAQQVEVTLSDAVQRALQVQPAMVEARGDERSAGASRRSAFGAFLPSLSTNASASRNNQPFTIQGDANAVNPQAVTFTNRVGSTTVNISQE